MEQIPFVNHTITNRSELFGRDGQLNILINEVDRRHDNINVVGCRRFGKTCLLEVLTKSIKALDDAHSYPIYIDPKGWNIGYGPDGKIGTATVYKYLLSILLESLTSDGILHEPVSIRDFKIDVVHNRHSFFDSIKDYSDSSIADTFADAIRLFAKKANKTIAFIFDEYEFLMTRAFGEPTGFQTLRKLSSEDDGGFRPFSYLVAGAVTWEHLCSTIGSKELNTIGGHIKYVKPLKKEDFSSYWLSECSKIEETTLKDKMEGKMDFVFNLSGGVVFYANDIAASMLSNEGEFLDGYYVAVDEIFDSLNFRQKETLFNVAISPERVQPGKDLIYLRNIGLVSPENLHVPMKLLNDWILEESRYQPTDQGTYIDVITDKINELIEDINDTVYNKGYIYMFTPQNRDNSLTKTIKKLCVEELGFGTFVDALWKTHFEKTKDEVEQKNKAFLPEKFRSTQYTDIIGTLRHTYSGHLYGPKFHIPSGRLTKEDALFSLVGSKNEPHGEQEFLTLQKAILDMYEVELNGILEEVRTWDVATE